MTTRPVIPLHGVLVTMLPVSLEGWLFRDLDGRGDELDGLIGYLHRDEAGFGAVWMVPAPATEHFSAIEPAIQAAELRCAAHRKEDA